MGVVDSDDVLWFLHEDQVDIKGYTAMHFAALRGSMDVIACLPLRPEKMGQTSKDLKWPRYKMLTPRGFP